MGIEGNVVELNGQTKTVTPSTSQQVITPDQNYNALTQVTVEAVPDESSVLNAQDTLLSTQDIKISDLATALDNKIALDLTNATSDANATASDIVQGKSAYVNGQKIEGTNQGNIPNWSEIGYSDTPQGIIDGFDYAKQIKDTWNSSITTMNSKYVSDLKLVVFPLVDTSNVTNMFYTFGGLSNKILPLISIPNLDTSNVTTMSHFVYNCGALKHFPLLNTNKVTDMQNMVFKCYSLDDNSLNNILRMCINSAVTSNKTLQYIGLDSSQATRCQTLSNWNDFVSAGWTTGY